MKKFLLFILAVALTVPCFAKRRWVPPRFANVGTEIQYLGTTYGTDTNATSNVSVTITSDMVNGCVVLLANKNYSTTNTQTITATFDGVTIPLVWNVDKSNGSNRHMMLGILALGNKAAGTYTCQIVGLATSTQNSAISLFNYVDQTTPYVQFTSGTGFVSSRTTTPSSSIGDLAFLMLHHTGSTLTSYGAGQIPINDELTTSTRVPPYTYKVATTPTTTQSITLAGNTNTTWLSFVLNYN